MTNKKLFALVVLLFSIFSCKDTDRMPKLGNEDKTEAFNPENLNADVDGPKIQLGVDMVLSVGDKNKSRAMTLDLVDVTHNSTIQKNVNVRWVNGEKYDIFACIRYRNTNDQDDWKPVYTTLTGIVSEASADNHSGKLSLSGKFEIPKEYLQNSTSGSLELKDKDNWFLAGIFISRTHEDGSVDKIGEIVDGKKVKLENAKTAKFIAVPDNAKSFEMDVPLCIPFQHVQINKNDKFIPSTGTEFKVRPLGTVINFKLTNDLAYSVNVLQAIKIKVKSRLIFNDDIFVDFWQYGDRLKHLGTDKFEFHYDNSKGASLFDSDGKLKEEIEFEIDWSQTKGLITGIEGDANVTLGSGSSMNFYTWSLENVNYPDHLNLYDPSDPGNLDKRANINVKYYEDINLTIMYPDNSQHAVVSNGNHFGELTTWGYAAETLTGLEQADGEERTFNYLTFNSTSKPHFAGGKVYTIPMTIKSDLTISEVYSEWDDSSSKNPGLNNSLIEIFNPNNTPIKLSDYYIARTIYEPSREYPFVRNGQSGRGDLLFRSTWYNDSPRPQYAMLMPLDLTQQYGFTIAGSKGIDGDPSPSFLIHDYDANKKTHWTNGYQVFAKAVYPTEHATITRDIAGGTVHVYGAYGVYQNDRVGENVIEVAEGQAEQSHSPKFFGVYDVCVNANGKGNVPQNKPTDVNTDSENESKYSGVMSKAVDQGWVLFKKVGDKFYIIDSFGPARTSGIDQNKMYSPDYFTARHDKTMLLDIRKKNILFPQGPYMYKDAWTTYNDPVEIDWDNTVGGRY